MASSALAMSHSINNTNTSEDDDNETWKALASLSSSGDNIEMKPRLDSLARRFHGDIESATDFEYWKDLCLQARSKGFQISDPQTPSTTGSNQSGSAVPALFQSESGRKHVTATAALLGLSEHGAIKLTTRVLRSLQDDESKFQSLLGTRELVLKTLYFHFDERLARLSVVTECLRLEQDKDALERDVIVEFLDSIDRTYQDEGRERGIFRRLLTISCKVETPPDRNQLQPSKELRASTPNTLHHSLISHSQGDAMWEQFVAECNDANRTQAMRERTEAMEALLVLLYSRINFGVQRSDFACLLIAFQSSYGFFTACTDGSRLCQLAGIICAECMGLWRAFEAQDSGGASWVSSHPMLLGAVASGNSAELECLKLLLVEYAENVVDRNMKQLSVQGKTNAVKELQVEAPEALALLSFGLLLSLACRSITSSSFGSDLKQYWQSLGRNGLEMAQIANDKCGAFDYLYVVMESLVTETTEVEGASNNDGPYDWQFSKNESNPLLLENGSRNGVSDATVAYASIGREILEASISAFDGILLLNQVGACDNIGMLSNLAAVIFRNNPILCNPFWAEWNDYTSGQRTPSPSPMCHLMESAHSLAVAALNSAKMAHNEISAGNILLPSVAPILCLLASLCSESDAVEGTVSMLPDGLIRTTLLHCKSRPTQGEVKSRISVLQSMSTLTRIGISKSCRDQLRRSLEESPSAEVDGPRVLSRIIDGSNDVEAVHYVMRIMANLLEFAPQRWPLQLARSCSGLSVFLTQENAATHSATLLLSRLVDHLTTVLFCKSFSERDSLDFLRGMAKGVLAAGTALASSLSLVKRAAPISFDSAHTILQTYLSILKSIGSVIELHKTQNVRSAAFTERENLISFFASSTGFGQAIAYYATAPVSLSLVIRLQKFLDDQSVLRAISDDGDGQGLNKKYGAWVSATSGKRESSGTDLLTSAKTYLNKLTSTSETLDLDLRGIHARGWTNGSDEMAPVRASSAAVRLLALWARHAEDIASKHGYNKEGQTVELDDSGKKVLAALSPQILFSSLASSPLPVRNSGTLSSAWSAAKLSNFDLLLRYISNCDSYGGDMSARPTAATLDLFYACISHVQSSFSSEEAADSSLFRSLHRSSPFPILLLSSVSKATDVVSSGSLGQNEKSTVACGLLALRVLTACIRAVPSFAETFLNLDPSKIRMAFVDPISRVFAMLESSEGDYQGSILQKEGCISQLRVAGGCISVIHALRISHAIPQGSVQAPRPRLSKIVDFEATILNNLLLLITEHASAVDVAKSFAVNDLGGSCALVTFMSLALDTVAAEMSLAIHDEDKGAGTKKAFEKIFGGNYAGLVPMAQSFSSFNSYSMVAKATFEFQRAIGEGRSRAELASPKALLASLPSTSVSIIGNDFYALQNAFDIASVNRCLSAFATEDNSYYDSVMALGLSHQLVSGELQLLSSWRHFAETLPFFLKYSPSSIANQNMTLSKSRDLSGETMFELVRETLRELNINTEAVNVGQVEISADFLWEETNHMTRTLSGMLLFFSDLCTRIVETTSQTFDLKNLLATLNMLAQTSEKLFTVTMSRRSGTSPSQEQMQSCCKLEQRVFASACVLIGLMESKENGAPRTLRRQRDDIYNHLAATCGKVLKVLVFLASDASQANHDETDDAMREKRQYREAFLTSSSLLTLLVSRTSSSLDESNGYFRKISTTLSDYGMLESLLEQAVLASATAAALRSSMPGCSTISRLEEAETVSVVKSVLTLLNSIAGIGDPDMLALLAGSRLVQLVANNPLFFYASNGYAVEDSTSTPRRGYIPSGEQGSVQRKESSRNSSAMAFYSGRDDPIHDVWLTAMMVLRASLRSSARLQTPGAAEEMKARFFDVALEFLGAYHFQLLGCLKECSAVLSDPKSSFFTLNALNEASTILGLVSELCSRTNRNQFLRSQKGLYDEFLRWSTFVVVSISKFLGASGTSRELFLALSQYDTADQQGYGEYPTPLQSRHPAFAGGVQNAKHEATRYSHFASSCCACVTRNDFEAASMVPSHLKHLSQEKTHDSALERNCRLSVTSIFVLQLEQVAAECLSQAISVIWSTHPSASSFVMLSESEASQIDTMLHVKPGTIIAFRPARKRRFVVAGEAEALDSIKFGRVLFSDTVNRTWKVEIIDRSLSQAEPGIHNVPVALLAGIEDVSKRKCVAAYAAAPDSATELENMQPRLTLGHLILALRWCHQDSTTSPANEPGRKSNACAFIQRLAEQITALLGSELSLHEEVGSRENIQKAEQSKLDAQVLELFGDLSDAKKLGLEAGEGLHHNPLGQEGRLKSVLCESSWLLIQPQVQGNTTRARADIMEGEKKRMEGRNAQAVDGSWYGGIRRSGHKSPFRGFG